MTIDRAGVPFIALAAIPAVVSAFLGPPILTGVLALLPIAIALFFRDPERTPPDDRGVVLAPADGKVMYTGPSVPGQSPPGEWQQVTIFLSVLDVHINRAPVGGRVTRVEYVPGTFRPAYQHDAHRNEHSEIWIDHQGQTIVARQVVGLLARRVVCRVKAGDDLAAGERIGLMKFGSRMDVFMPPGSTIAVERGVWVKAGVTIIGVLPGPPR